MTKTPHEGNERLATAYERMLERARDAWHDAEDRAGDALQAAIEEAAETAVDLGELTRDEASLLSTYVQRDLRDAAARIAETGHELKDWVELELNLVEQWLVDRLADVADKTKLELLRLNAQGRGPEELRAGQITAPGVLVCRDCGARLRLEQTSEIPACTQCGGTRFSRRGSLAPN